MNGLVQYGIGRGALAGTAVVDTDQANPAPVSVDQNQLRDRLVGWIKAGDAPEPAVNESNRLYFIFPPSTTQLTRTDINDPFCGYHDSWRYNDTSNSNDLFWGTVVTMGSAGQPAQRFFWNLSACVGHEISEACSDRDGLGYKSANGCEIGDLCETKDFFTYGSWIVEQYWSNWDSACLHGDNPVSFRRFANAIGFDVNHGLKKLGTPKVNIEYIASRMR